MIILIKINKYSYLCTAYENKLVSVTSCLLSHHMYNFIKKDNNNKIIISYLLEKTFASDTYSDGERLW